MLRKIHHNRRIVEAWSTRDSPPFVAANASEDFPKHPDKYTDNNAHASQFLFLLSCDIALCGQTVSHVHLQPKMRQWSK
ncbi:hypothetical protein MTP99_004061 [Tenebrio molitor]|nr:hypothetical protein MTP99_004061 [Tenebrio molitor]